MSDSEERTEAVSHALNELRELGQKWNDRLTTDNLRLRERYGTGEIEIIVHVEWRPIVPGKSKRFCAVLQNGEPAHGGHRLRFGKVGGNVSDELLKLRDLIDDRATVVHPGTNEAIGH